LRIRVLGLILIHLLITLLEVLSGMLGVEKRLRSLLRRLLPVYQHAAGMYVVRGSEVGRKT
jgi:hypothetical protein